MDRHSGLDRSIVLTEESRRKARRGVKSVRGIPEDDVPDLVQDVQAKAWEKFHQFNATKGDFYGWLYRIAQNHAKTHLKDLSRQPGWRQREEDWGGNWGREWPEHETVDSTADELPQTHFLQPDEALVRSELFQAVDAILGGLVKDQVRSVFTLHFDDLTGPEIAERLGIATHQVEYRLLKAREALRAGLIERGLVGRQNNSGNASVLE